MEATRPTSELILNTLADFRRDTADRFDRLEGRMDTLETRVDRVDQKLDQVVQGVDQLKHGFDQVIRLLGGDPGPS